jgi:hypothetical protein
MLAASFSQYDPDEPLETNSGRQKDWLSIWHTCWHAASRSPRKWPSFLSKSSLAGERIERKLSVSDAKISRRNATNVAASVDAYAVRIASAIQTYPDPRTFMNADDALVEIAITGRVDGPLAVGTELFDLGEVTTGGKCIARAGSITAAQIVRAVLLIEPEVTVVKVSKAGRLQRLQREWQAAVKWWQTEFDSTAEKMLGGSA